MRHPFQTDTFNPGAPELLQWVQGGERLTDLNLGATVYLVDGERWVIISGWEYTPDGPTGLAYPLSGSVEVIPAVKAFEHELGREAAKLRANCIVQAQATPQLLIPGLPDPRPDQPRTAPRECPVALTGAEPLHGLEWTVFW